MLNFLKKFSKNIQISNFKNPSSGSQAVPTHTQTDNMMKLIFILRTITVHKAITVL